MIPKGDECPYYCKFGFVDLLFRTKSKRNNAKMLLSKSRICKSSNKNLIRVLWPLCINPLLQVSNHYLKKTVEIMWTQTLLCQGPVVQSIVSLTSSLRVISLTISADSIYNILIFFAEKMWVAFALQKLLTFFQQKISAYLRITWFKF